MVFERWLEDAKGQWRVLSTIEPSEKIYFPDKFLSASAESFSPITAAPARPEVKPVAESKPVPPPTPAPPPAPEAISSQPSGVAEARATKPAAKDGLLGRKSAKRPNPSIFSTTSGSSGAGPTPSVGATQDPLNLAARSWVAARPAPPSNPAAAFSRPPSPPAARPDTMAASEGIDAPQTTAEPAVSKTSVGSLPRASAKDLLAARLATRSSGKLVSTVKVIQSNKASSKSGPEQAETPAPGAALPSTSTSQSSQASAQQSQQQ